MRRARMLAVAAVIGAVTSVVALATPAQAATVERVAGGDRYATAAELSKLAFTPDTTTVYVATGLGFADALAASPVAGADGAPILLVTQDSVPDATKTELQRLTPNEIVIVGGTGAVSTAVEDQLKSLAGTVRRIAGATRWETAQKLSADQFSPGVPVAYLASGMNFPDALGGGAAAAELGGPVLLVDAASTPGPTSAELDRLDPASIVVLGGSGAVSPEVAADVARFGPVRRLAGPERFATSAGISRDTFKTTAPTVLLATGLAFPDALAGSAAAAKLDGALVLVNRECITRAVNAEIDRLQPQRIVLLGGSGAATDDVVARKTCPDAGAKILGTDLTSTDSSGYHWSGGSGNINGQSFGQVIRTNPACTSSCSQEWTVRWIDYDLGGAYSSFTTTVGMLSDSDQTDDSYRFEVILDGVPIFAKELTGLNASQGVSLNVVGGLRLRLQITRLLMPNDSFAGFGAPTIYTS